MKIFLLILTLSILYQANANKSENIDLDSIAHPTVYLTENIDILSDEQLFSHYHKLMKKKEKYELLSDEGVKRFNIFKSNLVEIREHNADKTNTYSKGITFYTDLTEQEFYEDRNMITRIPVERKNEEVIKLEQKRLLQEQEPEKLGAPFKPLDWRAKKGVNVPLSSPSGCETSAHFSFVAALETCYFAKTGQLPKLSYQQVMDCHPTKCANFPPAEYKYFLDSGIQAEATYPYSGKGNLPCQYNPAKAVAKPKAWAYRQWLFKWDAQSSYANLQHCPYVAIQGFRTPRDYAGGIYSPPDCSPTSYYNLITVVGYGIDKGEEYWIVNIHYGDWWGDKGFLKVKRRDDQSSCGVAGNSWSRPTFD